MTQHTVSHTRPAPQRRPGARDESSWQVPVALMVLSLARTRAVLAVSQ